MKDAIAIAYKLFSAKYIVTVFSHPKARWMFCYSLAREYVFEGAVRLEAERSFLRHMEVPLL